MDTIPISLANVKNMWVGESERNLRQAIDIIESNAPVTLILDECDQLGMGSRTGSSAAHDSSSVDSGLRGILLEWLGDIGADNGISVVAMSNNARGVDPAFRDRMKIIPVLEAGKAEDKAKIAAIQLRRQGVEYDEAEMARAFAESGKNFTGRQIVIMLGKAARNAKLHGGPVGYDDIKVALDNMLHAFGHSEELMALTAVKFTAEKEYLPWVAAKAQGREDARPPAYIQPFLAADGVGCDEEKLDGRIAELEMKGV
jgi:AAA+ superfamily predicted ATPase